MNGRISRNWGFDLVRATEAAARAAGRWMGLGGRDEADMAAITAMHGELQDVDFDGYIIVGEESKLGIHSPLEGGQRVGTGRGPGDGHCARPDRRAQPAGRRGARARSRWWRRPRAA